MIVLDVEECCHDCEHFKAQESTQKLTADCKVQYIETVVRCANSELYAKLKEKFATQEDE